jgi:hypothetical protein
MEPAKYKLDEFNAFDVPNAGKYRLNLEGRYVELVTSSKDRLAPAIYNTINSLTSLSISGHDAPFVVSKGFANLEKLEAEVPGIAELSKKFESAGGTKPRFVLAVGGASDLVGTAKIEHVERALLSHGLDPHVEMV